MGTLASICTGSKDGQERKAQTSNHAESWQKEGRHQPVAGAAGKRPQKEPLPSNTEPSNFVKVRQTAQCLQLPFLSASLQITITSVTQSTSAFTFL